MELLDTIKGFFSFLWRNKMRIALIPVLMLAWVPLIFPYSDLRSVVATTVSRAMGDGFAIDFTGIALAPGFPFALALEEFEFNGPGLPTVEADRLVASPSISSIFSRSPSGSIDAEGMFKGNVTASLSSGARVKAGGSRQDISANVTGVQLGLLTASLQRAGMLPLTMQGTVDSTTNASIDPGFEEQPEGDVFLQGKTISIPSVQVPLPGFGSLQTPSLDLGRLDIKGKLRGGKLQIEDLSFGQATDALTGRVRGELSVSFSKDQNSGRVTTVIGPFDLKVELSITKPLMDAMTKSGAGLALLPVLAFQTVTGETTKYAFGVKGESFGPPPQFYGLKQ